MNAVLGPIDASGPSEIEGEVFGRIDPCLGFRDTREALDPVRRREGTEMEDMLAEANACRFCWLVVDRDGATRLMLELEETSAGVEL